MKKSLITLLVLSLARLLHAQTCVPVITGGSYSPNPCNVANTLALQATLHNNGTQTCQNISVTFYLSLDAFLDGNDCSLGSTFVTIAPGANANAARNVAPLSSVPCAVRGLYYIIAQESGTMTTHVLPGRLVVWPPEGSYACEGTGVLDNHQDHVDAHFDGSSYTLLDYTRRADNNIHGHNGNMVADAYIQASSAAGGNFTAITDVDGIYDSGVQCPGVDAQVYAGLTYDYLLHVLGRNGPDDGQALEYANCMQMYVENDDAYNGAHNHTDYPFTPGYVCFGSHDGLRHSMAGAIEIVGHEWGHTVTCYESNLTYYAESGSLNDSWSDMLGIAVAFWTGVDPDWQDGEDVWVEGRPVRDLQNPHSLWDDRHEGGYFPDTYHGPGWYYGDEDECGIHHNGTVAGHFFYLLSIGGTQNGITVQGVGIDTAITILYHANRDYWTEATDFANAREGCISAAAEMNAAYANAVMDAWAAVGVGLPATPPQPVTRLTVYSASNGTDALLRWSHSGAASSYHIYAGDAPNFPCDPAHFVAATANLQYVHLNGLASPMRFYQVLASTDAP
jgi:hypothetical protein